MSDLGLCAMIFLLIFLLLLGILFYLTVKKPFSLGIAYGYLKRNMKMNLALMSAACVSTIVICGSLIAGDSLRESITNAAYENLGEVDEIITSDRLFNASLVDGLSQDGALMESVDHLAPLIYLNGIAENPRTGTRSRNANIIGFEDSFLKFGTLKSIDGTNLDYNLDKNEVYLNEMLADEQGIKKGERVNITFSDPDQLFEAIFLGEQEGTNLRIQFEVSNIVSNEDLGRFQLNANRNPPQNVYVSIESLQDVLGKQNTANMILVSNNGDEREGEGLCSEVFQDLKRALNNALGFENAGLKIVENIDKGYLKLESEDVFFSYDYYELLSSSPQIEELNASSPIITYFWNSLTFENSSVWYSTICAFDSELDLEFGLFTLNGTSQEIEGALEEDEIILNNWTAEKLQVGVGDALQMNYSLLDEFYNINYLNKNFTVRYIVDIKGKANDSMLMPDFPGIKGKISAFDWDPPFPIYLEKITNDDEKYWQKYEGTPKAFIDFSTGEKLWKTDIGNITQIRMLPKEESNLSALRMQVEDALNDYVGISQTSLTIKTVKTDSLNSAEGIELFTQMFLAFSAACIIASIVLIALLITLRVESRMTEIGTLRALGFGKGTINQIFLLEGTFLAITGGFFGTLLGLLFGFFLITGMNTFWSSIVEGSSVTFHFTIESLTIGFCLGVIISIIAMWFVLRYEGKRPIIRVLKRMGKDEERKREIYLPTSLFILGLLIILSTIFFGIELLSEIGLLVLSIGTVFIIFSVGDLISLKIGKSLHNLMGFTIVIFTLLLMSYFVDSVPIIELFFLSGFMLLFGFLLVFYHFLKKAMGKPFNENEKDALGKDKRWIFSLAKKNAARRPKRTMFTVFLFSLTLFVLVSLTINLQGAVYDVDKALAESGGGYQIMGESTNPIFANLEDENSRITSGIHSDVFNELDVMQFKTKGDVGGTCSNLNRAANPRIIGANESFFYENSINFVSHAELKGEENPWFLLKRDNKDEGIPAIGDYNTIVWILGLDLGSTISVIDEAGKPVNLKIVGITGNSIFQGSLMISIENFNTMYPTKNGYQLFLFKSNAEDLKPQISQLENALAKYGFDAYSVKSVVIESILIENTYISIFQVILLFGLLIGTLGFGIVASRNALERRREIGIFRAIGISKNTIFKSLLLENSYVILCAIIIGTLAGIIASSVYLIELHLDVFTWPWLYILLIILISYVVAMISAVIPIFKSSMISVTKALRISE